MEEIKVSPERLELDTTNIYSNCSVVNSDFETNRSAHKLNKYPIINGAKTEQLYNTSGPYILKNGTELLSLLNHSVCVCLVGEEDRFGMKS